MKKLISIILICFFSLTKGQPPQAINYQGVARDSVGHPLINQNIGIKLSILDSSNTGQAVYVETHSLNTNASGLFNLSIGLGTVLSGNFSTIPWGQGDKWLKVEMVIEGGNNFSLIGVTQFLSVPYALFAGTSGNNRLSIGQHYAGGIIFYIDSTSQHGLVCTEMDQGLALWGCYGILIGGTSELIGTGQQNTTSILASCFEINIPAKICDDLVLNGYDDWYLPSKYELNLIFKNLIDNGIGKFTFEHYYWSSSEYNSIYAAALATPPNRPPGGSGGIIFTEKNSEFLVRAIRTF